MSLNSFAKGGEVIASGGFGCVFDPALKCDNDSVPRAHNEVSKLMIAKYANEEYEDTKKYKKMLETIPNYRKYFLVDGFTLCNPAPLTKQDLKGFKTRCKALTKKNITQKRVNKKLGDLKMINMPYGGEDLGDYIEKNMSPFSLANANDLLIDLLENGIIPMNARGVYHLDIKESNILINISTNGESMVRLIDWGLSCTYKKGDDIPKELTRRSFQYNAPMSIIILHSKFRDAYDDILEDTPSPDYEVIQEFVSNFILDWFAERGLGHFKTVHEILEELFKKKSKSKSKTTMKDEDSAAEKEKEEKVSSSAEYLIDTSVNYSRKTDDQKYIVTYMMIINYITDILVQYTFEGRSHIVEYFEEVFIKNADAWGFIMAYTPMLEYYCNNHSNLGQQERNIYIMLQNIFVDYLYASPLNVIDTTALQSDLKHLSKALRSIDSHNKRPPSTKNKSSFTDSTLLDENSKTNSKESNKILSAIIKAFHDKK